MSPAGRAARSIRRAAGAQGWHMVFRTGVIALALAALLAAAGGYHAGFAAMNAWGGRLPSALLQTLTSFGDSLLAAVLLLLVAHRHPRMLWAAVLGALAAAAMSHGFKSGLHALRPAAVLPAAQFHLLGPRYRLESFPSGHAVTAFLSAGVLAGFAARVRTRLLWLAAASLVAASRVWVGAHWPVDVLAGAGMGCLCAVAGGSAASAWNLAAWRSGHALVVGLLIVAALAVLVLPLPYRLAEPAARALALIALLRVGWHFLRPHLARRWPPPAPRSAPEGRLAAPEDGEG